MLWFKDSPHALLLAPSYTYSAADSDLDKNEWTFCRPSPRPTLPRGQFEYFFEDGDTVFYIGTFTQEVLVYKIQLRQLNRGEDTVSGPPSLALCTAARDD